MVVKKVFTLHSVTPIVFACTTAKPVFVESKWEVVTLNTFSRTISTEFIPSFAHSTFILLCSLGRAGGQ